MTLPITKLLMTRSPRLLLTSSAPLLATSAISVSALPVIVACWGVVDGHCNTPGRVLTVTADPLHGQVQISANMVTSDSEPH